MQKDAKAVEGAGIKVVGISTDSADVLKAFAEKQKITFPLLSDEDGKTIAAYALKNPDMAGKKAGKINFDGIPYPGTILVDRDGVIRAKLFVDGYKERHSTAELVEAAKKLKQ